MDTQLSFLFPDASSSDRDSLLSSRPQLTESSHEEPEHQQALASDTTRAPEGEGARVEPLTLADASEDMAEPGAPGVVQEEKRTP